jgi:hypothetical protein
MFVYILSYLYVSPFVFISLIHTRRLDLDLFSKQAKSESHLGTKVVRALRELFDSLGARVDQQKSITDKQGREYPWICIVLE